MVWWRGDVGGAVRCYGDDLLTRLVHVDDLIGLHLNLVSRRQERVEANNQVRVTFKQVGYTVDHTGCINAVN